MTVREPLSTADCPRCQFLHLFFRGKKGNKCISHNLPGLRFKEHILNKNDTIYSYHIHKMILNDVSWIILCYWISQNNTEKVTWILNLNNFVHQEKFVAKRHTQKLISKKTLNLYSLFLQCSQESWACEANGKETIYLGQMVKLITNVTNELWAGNLYRKVVKISTAMYST